MRKRICGGGNTYRLDDEGRWITTKNGHKVHLNENGEPDKGNTHVIAKMTGETVRGSVGTSAGTSYTGSDKDSPAYRSYEKALADYRKGALADFEKKRDNFERNFQSAPSSSEREAAKNETNQAFFRMQNEFKKVKQAERKMQQECKPVETVYTKKEFGSASTMSDHIKRSYSDVGDTVSFTDKEGIEHSFVCVGKAKDATGHVSGQPKFSPISNGVPSKEASEFVSAVDIGRKMYKSSGKDSRSSFGKFQYEKGELP